MFRKPKAPAPKVPENRAHPLQAIPHRAHDVEERRSDLGELHLYREIPPRNRLEAWFNRLARSRKTQQVALDEKGGLFWQQIDGHQNLAALAKRMRRAFNLDRNEAEEAVVLFPKMLMRRYFIYLEVYPEIDAAKSATRPTVTKPS